MAEYESRKIESLRTEPKPRCSSRMLSLRLGPWFAPGSLLPFGRWSEPRISTVLPVSRLPPGLSACFAESGSLGAVCALTRKTTTVSRSQPSAANASHFSTRLPVTRRGALRSP